jgi:hypothetical protein
MGDRRMEDRKEPADGLHNFPSSMLLSERDYFRVTVSCGCAGSARVYSIQVKSLRDCVTLVTSNASVATK